MIPSAKNRIQFIDINAGIRIDLRSTISMRFKGTLGKPCGGSVIIGLVNDNPEWGGGEQWFSDAAQAMAERGHELVLAARKGTRLFETFQELGHCSFAMDDLGRDFFDQRPQVVLCNSARELRRLIRLAPEPLGFRIVMRRGIDRPLRDNLFRRHFWNQLSAILVNSDATGRTVRGSLPWFPETRIRRIYNPVSIQVAPHVNGNTNVFRLGACGRLVKQKGFAFLLEAVARLGSEIEWSLVIAGDGKLRKKLEAHAKRLGLGHRCHFLGQRDTLSDFYANLDVLIVPSLYEGFGFVAVEAALAGLPVVASNTSSLTEIVIDGTTGMLVPPRDAPALAAAIQRLAQDRKLAASYGQAAQHSAHERFNPTRLQNELSDFLEDCAQLPPVGG